MNFQEHPSNGSQGTTERAHFCSCEVSVIIDQSEKNCLFSRACVKSARYEFWEKSLKWKARCNWKYYSYDFLVPFITLVNEI